MTSYSVRLTLKHYHNAINIHTNKIYIKNQIYLNDLHGTFNKLIMYFRASQSALVENLTKRSNTITIKTLFK